MHVGQSLARAGLGEKYDEINREYSHYVLNFISKQDKEKIKNAKLKVIIDPNGGTGISAREILEKLNVKVHGINMGHGIFNRLVEPNEDSLIYLSNEVREKNYDFAAGFDCDADRVEIVTKKGIVSGNKLLALVADDILKNAKNRAVVVNDATSLVAREIAKRHKAKYFETQVGEINVIDKMYAVKAPVGGEGSSSGVIIPDSRCRDGTLTLIYLLKIIAGRGKSLDELVKDLPEFYNIKNKVNFKWWQWIFYVIGWIAGFANLLFWLIMYMGHNYGDPFFNKDFHRRVYIWGIVVAILLAIFIPLIFF